VPCRGRSGTVVVDDRETHKYDNSCETLDLLYYMLLGSRLGSSGTMWWIFLSLGALSFGLSIIPTVRGRKTPSTTPA
jgi:hypothetical protein